MLSYDKMKEKIKGYLTPCRYEHTLGVIEAAIKLASKYQVEENSAKIAALLHDCAKNKGEETLLRLAKENNIQLNEVEKMQPSLLHGPIGSVIAQKDFGIKNKDILNAIRYHTTGKKNMTTLEKIIYLSDYIERGRNFPGVEKLRIESKKDLDQALLLAFNQTIEYVLKKGSLLHVNTVKARNDIIIKVYGNIQK